MTTAAADDVAPRGTAGAGGQLNRLRAGVLGANDGIISTAGLVVGVAGATADRTALLVAGAAGLLAGAFSMAGGEYVSVSTQRDTELALGADPDRAVSPWQAAAASAGAFVLGAILPLLAIVLPPASLRLPVTIGAVVVALTLTAVISARLGRSRVLPAVARTVGVGGVAMAVTYTVGSLVGTAI